MIKLRFRQRTIQHINALTVLKYHDGWNAANPKLRRKLLLGFSINLYKTSRSGLFLRDIRENRSKADARIAP
ncbi:hypothetical protein D038_2449A, partial [Vibrio parahaemolyticus IDH02189]